MCISEEINAKNTKQKLCHNFSKKNTLMLHLKTLKQLILMFSFEIN